MEDLLYTLHMVYAIFMFVAGTLFGSFFTLATYRIPRKQDIIKTRSYCPTCKHRLGFFDCFPILSYVSTFGKCRYCKQKISIRYPLIELASGFVFLFIYLFKGLSISTLILIACYIYLFLVIGCDIMEGKMTELEKAEVAKIVEERNSEKKKKKAGSLNIEILIAVCIFVFFFVIAMYTMSNYTNTLAKYKKQSDALLVLYNTVNQEKAKSYDELSSFSSSVELDGVSYDYTVSVTDQGLTKDISVQVKYAVAGEVNTISEKILKVVQ